MADIEAEVKRILRESLDVTDEQLTPEADIFDDLGADSLDATEITMQLEDAFGMEVPDEDAQKLRKVQQIVDYVKAHVPAEAKKR